MENTLTVTELKRRGAAAIDEGLKRGPIHILKRNKSARGAVGEGVPAPDFRGSGKIRGMTAMEWLLAHPGPDRLSKQQIDPRLREERNW